MDRKMLHLLLAAAGVALVVLIAAFGRGGPDSTPVGSVPASWRVRPVWSENRRSDPSHGRPLGIEPRTLAVYLDVSEPMGGFLPPPSRPLESSAFRSVVVNLVPEQLERVSGSTSTPLEWFFVAARPQPGERPATLTREMFQGGESRLNEAVATILSGFDEGRLKAAALITDLVSTENLTGAMGVAMALKDRMSSEGVQRGDLHVGLLGVRAPYLGVKARSCRPPGELGCWFSEQAQRYEPLTRPAKVPFYVLILGRGFEPVQEIGEGIRAGAAQLGLETHWQVLTVVTKERQIGGAECTAHRAGRRREPQYTLVRREDGKVRCQQEDDVEILCPLPSSLGFEPQRGTASWLGAGVALEGKIAVVTLSCAALRASPPVGDLTVKIEGPPALDQTQWKEWSTESDDREQVLGRTLQLSSFLDTVRPKPERLEATAGVLQGGVTR